MTVAELSVNVNGRIDELERELGKAQIAIQAFSEKGTKSVAEMGAKMAKQCGEVGRSMTMGLTAPLVAAGIAAAKMSADFADSMAKVEGAAGAGHAEIVKLRGAVLDLAIATGKGPKELADGLYFVESMGYRGAAAMDIMSKAAKLSAAGMGSTADIASTVTFAINAYGKGNLTAAKATDVLAAAVREGAMAPDALAGAIGRVLPEASRMGIGFDKLAGSLAAMTRIGLNVDEAVTAIRQTLLTLDHPSKQTQKALGSVGLTAAQVSKALKEDFIGTLGVLAKASEHGGEAFQRIFPNVRAFTGVLALTGKQSKEVAALIDRVTHSTGSADQIFKVASATSGAEFRRALQAITVAGIALGDRLAPVLIKVAEHVKQLAEAWAHLSPDMQDTIVKVALVVAALGPLLMILGKVAAAIRAIIELKTAYSAAMAAMRAASLAAASSDGIGAIAIAATGATTAVGALTAALAAAVVAGLAWKQFSDAYSSYDDRQKKADDKFDWNATPLDRAKKMSVGHPTYNREGLGLSESDYAKLLAWQKDRAAHAASMPKTAAAHAVANAPKIPPLKLGPALDDGKGDKAAKKEVEEYTSALNELRAKLMSVNNETEVHRALVSRLTGDYANFTKAQYANLTALARLVDAHDKAAATAETYKSALADLKVYNVSAADGTHLHDVQVSILKGDYAGLTKAQITSIATAAKVKDSTEAVTKALQQRAQVTNNLANILSEERQKHMEIVATNNLDRTSIELLGKSYANITNWYNQLVVAMVSGQRDRNAADKQSIDDANELNESYKDLLSTKINDLATMRLQTDTERLNFQLTYGNLRSLTQAQKDWLTLLQKQIDATQKQIDQAAVYKAAWVTVFKAAQDAAKKANEETQKQVKEMSDRLADVLLKGMDQIHKNGFKGMFNSILKDFDSMLKDMAQAWLKSAISDYLQGALFGQAGSGNGQAQNGAGNRTAQPAGGKGGGIESLIGGFASLGASLFGGKGASTNASQYQGYQGIDEANYQPRAGGGPVSGGHRYLVGEHGPELYTPHSSGHITRNSDIGTGGDIHHHHNQINIYPPSANEMTQVAASEQAAHIARHLNRSVRRN